MATLTIEQVRIKATELMNAFKEFKKEEAVRFGKMTNEEKEAYFYEDVNVSEEQKAMVDFFRSFDEEKAASNFVKIENFNNPRGFTSEYKDLAFGR